MKFGAMILAAGASSRMGYPKALLKIGGKTFLRHIADTLLSAEIHNVVIVLGAKAELIEQQLDWFGGIVVTNSQWESGQLSSILRGLDVVEQKNLDAVFICPVDRPLITKHLMTAMMKIFSTKKKHIVVPTFGKRRGHPLLVGSAFFDELRNVSPLIGARQLLWNHPEEILEYATDSEGILRNVDTFEDYKKLEMNTNRNT